MLAINDLQINEELDHKALVSVFGGSLGAVVPSGLRVAIQPSVERETKDTGFASVLTSNVDAMGYSKLAAPYVPGGSVISAAINAVGSMSDSADK